MVMALVLSMAYAQKREALLIGNSDYKYITDLQNPKSSITGLKEALKSLGFQVTTAYDLDSENLSAEVEKFRDRLSRDSIGFFYYSGHGCQLNNRSYLVPTNVDTKKSSKIKYHALAIEEVLHTLGQARNRVNMLFLDACRDVPTGTRGGTKGLGQISTTPKGTLVVYATESGKVAQDNTLFIKELTRTIQKPNKKVWEIGNDLSNSISAKTNENQVPEMFSKRLPPKLMLSTGVGLGSDREELERLRAKELARLRQKEKDEKIRLAKIKEEQNKLVKLYALTIEPTPSDAEVYIMNIKPTYSDGMKLKEGNYEIKVKAEGYTTKKKRVYLSRDASYEIILKKNSVRDIMIDIVIPKKKIINKKASVKKIKLRTTYTQVALYKRPSLDASIVISLGRNSKVTYINMGDDNNWMKVRTSSGLVGWVERKRVKEI